MSRIVLKFICSLLYFFAVYIITVCARMYVCIPLPAVTTNEVGSAVRENHTLTLPVMNNTTWKAFQVARREWI